MGEVFGTRDFRTIGGTPASESAALGTESDNLEWFAEAAWTLLGKDAGLHLHYLTGYPESSCYAYVAHDPAKRRKPPTHFLRRVLHSQQGEPFLLACMDGCTAQWWRDLQHDRRIAAQLRKLDFS